MNDRVRLAARVAGEWNGLTDDERVVARNALAVLDDNPIAGAPLLHPLRGYWTYRAANLRILYRIAAEGRMVAVLKIGRAPEEVR